MNSTTYAQLILEFKMICGTKFCINYERLWAFVYRHSITCPQEIKRSLCPDETHYRCLEGRVKSGGNAERLGNQLQHESPPGQKAIINLHLATLRFPAQLHARDSFVISTETSLDVSSHARLSWDSTPHPRCWSQLSDQFPFPASLLNPSSLSSHSPQHLSRLF